MMLMHLENNRFNKKDQVDKIRKAIKRFESNGYRRNYLCGANCIATKLSHYKSQFVGSRELFQHAAA